jgi:hypothetical protein
MIKPVRKLMEASGQAYPDEATSTLYMKLIDEEYKELKDATSDVERLDAVCDLMWVAVGYAIANGWLIRTAWDEVARSNMSKLDPETGKMLRREDGKYLKGPNYSAPDLTKFLA